MIKPTKKIDKDYLLNVFFIIAILISTVFLIWKAQYGFGKKDEALYLTTTLRIYNGDSLLFDEQHLSQLYSFLMLPIMSIYRLFIKDVEGILLNFRYIYIFFQLICAIFIYYRLKDINKIAAATASLAFYLYAPYNLMALSYNTICYMTLVASLLLICTYKKDIELLGAGILFAASVLCCPYLALFYFIYALYFLFKREHLKEFLYFTIGISILALVFVAFVLARTTIKDILKALPLIIDDPEYRGRSLLKLSIQFFTSIFTVSPFSPLCYLGYVAVIVMSRIKKCKKNIFLAIAYLITVILMLDITRKSFLINYALLPLNILMIVMILIDVETMDKKFIDFYLIPSIIYAFCINLSSDMGIKAISSALFVGFVISIFMIVKRIDYSRLFNSFNNAVLVGVVILSIAILMFERTLWVFNESSIYLANKRLNAGPYSGIYCDYMNEERYYEGLEESLQIRETLKEDDKIAILTFDIWKYLVFDGYEWSTPSPWKTYHSSWGVECLNDYYRVNPSKIADVIYVGDKFYDSIENLEVLKEYQEEHIGLGLIYHRK